MKKRPFSRSHSSSQARSSLCHSQGCGTPWSPQLAVKRLSRSGGVMHREYPQRCLQETAGGHTALLQTKRRSA